MLNDPKGYYESCRTVRVERRKILKFIKKAIINELSGSEVEDNELLKKISENIDDISERLQIESIMDLEEDCRAPIGMVNKPITI